MPIAHGTRKQCCVQLHCLLGIPCASVPPCPPGHPALSKWRAESLAMAPFLHDPLAVAPPQCAWYEPAMQHHVNATAALMDLRFERASIELAPLTFENRRQSPMPALQFSHEWLGTLSVPFKMDMVADFLASLWEPEPTAFHRETLRQIGLDLIEHFHLCDYSLLVAVGYLLRLKLVFDRVGIQTRDCSAQLFAVSLLSAVKFLYDVPPTNADWADVSHFDRRRLNQMEFELLEALEFRLFASPVEVNAALDAIVRHRSESLAPRRPVSMEPKAATVCSYATALDTYGEYEQWSDPVMGCYAYGTSSGHPSPLAAVPQSSQQQYAEDSFSLFHHALVGVPGGPETEDEAYGYGPPSEPAHGYGHGYGYGDGYAVHGNHQLRLQTGRAPGQWPLYGGFTTPASPLRRGPCTFGAVGAAVCDSSFYSDSFFATATF